MNKRIPDQLTNGAVRIDAENLGAGDIVRICRQKDLPLKRAQACRRMMAEKQRVDARGRSIKNEYRPVVRGFLDRFPSEILLGPDGPDGRFKPSKIGSCLIAELE